MKDNEPFSVWPQHWDVVELFFALSSQWRFAPNGRLAGIDYSAIEPTMKLLGKTASPQLFLDLRLMENVVLTKVHQAG